jgi:hypothetical protein
MSTVKPSADGLKASRNRAGDESCAAARGRTITKSVSDDCAAKCRRRSDEACAYCAQKMSAPQLPVRRICSADQSASAVFCPQQLCDVSSQFISKYPKQIQKKVKSETSAVGPVLRALQVEQRSELPDGIDMYLAQLHQELSADVAPRGRDGKVTVFVVGRTKKDASCIPSNWQARYGRLISLEFRTMHRSKGAEADYVSQLLLRSQMK